MLPYWFSAMTMKSVGKAALAMVEEVRRQFNEIEGLMEVRRGSFSVCSFFVRVCLVVRVVFLSFRRRLLRCVAVFSLLLLLSARARESGGGQLGL